MAWVVIFDSGCRKCAGSAYRISTPMSATKVSTAACAPGSILSREPTPAQAVTPDMNALRSAKDLQGDAIIAQDGAIGFIVDVYFDDERWAVRYLVVDTGEPMPRQDVLIPCSKIEAGQDDDAVHVRLTRALVKASPDADSDRPVARQHELTYAQRAHSDPHLRSSEVVSGCTIEAPDGTAGRVEDLIIDATSWTIAGVVVGMPGWLHSHQVLLPPQAVESIDWPYRKVRVRLARDAIQQLPAPPG